MPETQSEERECDLRVALLGYSGVNTSYDAKAGLKRSVVLSGRIDDPYLGGGPDFSAPHFHEKPVRLEISSPPDPEWLGRVRAARGVDEACGLVRVNAGVEPKRYEVDGEMIEEEPVKVILAVSGDAFEAIRHQASEAYDHRRIMWAKVTLIGKSLPELESAMLFLGDLDVSELRGYAVSDFEIFDTRYTDHLRGRVLSVNPERNERHVDISVLLTEASYGVNIERAYVHNISCEGRVISGRGKPYHDADVTIEFGEYEPNSVTDKLPERAFAGTFGYWPKQSKEGYSSTHLTFNLRHLPEDVQGLLIPLLSQEAGTRVLLNCTLIIKEENLLATVDELRGDVRYYSFEVTRHLINNGA
jgi:hypothetical protein